VKKRLGKLPLRRPRRRWENDSIKRDLWETGCKDGR